VAGHANDHAPPLGALDGLDIDGTVGGRLEQFLETFLPEQAPEAADLGGATPQTQLVAIHAAEERPLDVPDPALHQFLVAQVEAVLELGQAGQIRCLPSLFTGL
jgi:hypothetical protein